jgi:hypothetical protein
MIFSVLSNLKSHAREANLNGLISTEYGSGLAAHKKIYFFVNFGDIRQY